MHARWLCFVLTKWLREGFDPAVNGLLGVSSQVLVEQHSIPKMLGVDGTINNVLFHDKRQWCLLLLKQAATLCRLRTVGTLAALLRVFSASS